MGPRTPGLADHGQSAHQRLGVDHMAGIGVGVDAVAGERDLAVLAGRNLRLHVQLIAGNAGHHLSGVLHRQFALLFQPGDLITHVDGRNRVVVRDLLHHGSGARQFAVFEVVHAGGGDGVDEADIGFRKTFPYLADDSLHRAADVERPGARIVDRKFHEHQIRFMGKHIRVKPEYAEVGACSADRGVDLTDFGVLKQFPEIVQALHSPAVLGGDAAAEIGDPHVFAVMELPVEVRQAAADCVRFRSPGFEPVRVVGGSGGQHGDRRQQKGKQFHSRLLQHLRVHNCIVIENNAPFRPCQVQGFRNNRIFCGSSVEYCRT